MHRVSKIFMEEIKIRKKLSINRGGRGRVRVGRRLRGFRKI